jgi:pyruvate dehydrogenase E2 component (dihydrolipoamide acetyltransferase)
VELLGAGGGSDTLVFTTTELLGGAAGTPGGGCAGPEDDGGPGPAIPPVGAAEGGSDPEASPADDAGGELPPPTTGVPASAPPTAGPGGGQLGGAPAVPLPFADPAGSEHELPEFSPDELTVGPLPEGAVLVSDGVVVAEAGGVAGGEAGAVPASEPAPAEQSAEPAAVPPPVESVAPACVVVTEPPSAAVDEEVGGEQPVWPRAAPDMTPRNRTSTASASRQILLLRRAGDGIAKRTMR